MRTLTLDIVTTVEPIGAVSFACPPPSVGVNGLLPVSTVAVVDVPQWGSARLRPSARQLAALGRTTATGAGYGFGSDLASGVPGVERRTAAAIAAEKAASRTTSTTRNARATQRKQLHLMSRRDPCSWRPPV